MTSITAVMSLKVLSRCYKSDFPIICITTCYVEDHNCTVRNLDQRPFPALQIYCLEEFIMPLP